MSQDDVRIGPIPLARKLRQRERKVCDEVYMQLTSDLLARDKQNQNEGYVLG